MYSPSSTLDKTFTSAIANYYDIRECVQSTLLRVPRSWCCVFSECIKDANKGLRHSKLHELSLDKLYKLKKMYNYVVLGLA